MIEHKEKIFLKFYFHIPRSQHDTYLVFQDVNYYQNTNYQLQSLKRVVFESFN